MDRFVARVSRLVVLAAGLAPAILCYGDTPVSVPTETDQVSATVTVAQTDSVPVTETSVATGTPEAELPLFRHESYPAAWTAAQDSNKPILVYVTMPNCPHCTRMMEGTFGEQTVAHTVKTSFETLRANRYTHAVLVQKLHVRWYPTTVLVGSNNKVLDVIEGYVDAGAFQRRLQLGIAATSSETQTR